MTPLEVAKLWLHAFNTHNLEALLELYDDNAQHFSPKLKLRKPETNGLIIGKQAMRIWWQDAFERLPSLHYKEERLTANHNCVFMEYTRMVTGEEDMSVAEILVIENDKIIASRVYHG
jgi:ketosteroid isomerase-like protein